MSILVGIDDSIQGTAALRWAAQEAVLRNTPLKLLHAFPWPMAGVTDPRHLELWDAAQRLLAEAEHWARQITADVSTELVTAGPSQALIRRSGDAELIVVGTRGRGGFHGLLVGSVALQVAGHATCPVCLVGAESPPEAREIVVGVGDQVKEETLRTAFAEAALRGAPLRALHAWQPYAAAMSGPMTPIFPSEFDTQGGHEERLAGALAPWREKYPQVPLTTSVVSATPRQALTDASAGAGLLIVGDRDREEFPGLPLGSVTHAMAHHAKCPVIIAR